MPYSGRLVLRIDPRLHGDLAARAEASMMSLNSLIEESPATAVRPRAKPGRGPV